MGTWDLPTAGKQYADEQYERAVVKWYYDGWVGLGVGSSATENCRYALCRLGGLRVIGNIYETPELLTSKIQE